MVKTLSKRLNLLETSLAAINSPDNIYQLPIITAIVVFAVINFILVILITSQVSTFKPASLVGKVQSANLKTLKILQPKSGALLFGEFPVVLQSQEADQKFSSVMVLVDGVLEKEVDVSAHSQPYFTLNSAKYSPGPHKLVFKVTQADGSTQTLQIDVNFVNKRR